MAAGTPALVQFVHPSNKNPVRYLNADSQDVDADTAPGDGKFWRVPLGPPVATLSMSDVGRNDADLDWLRTTLTEWIRVDQLNRLAATLRFPTAWAVDNWETNKPPSPIQSRAYQTALNKAEMEELENALKRFLVALHFNYASSGSVEGQRATAPLLAFLSRRVESRTGEYHWYALSPTYRAGE